MSPPARGGIGALGAHVGTFAAFAVLSAAWSWPLVVATTATLSTRHFDLYPTLWAIARGPGTLPSLLHPESAWPVGESLLRLDSYVLLGLATLTQGLVTPVRLARLLVWLGPALNAFAAERCAASGFGVRRPWSLLAGLAYGFSGIAGTAVLEGHVYHLLNPWLPLVWLAWRRGVAPGGSASWGLLAGAAWALALCTTGYFGVLATILVAVCVLGSPLSSLRLLPGFALVAGPVAWLWFTLYQRGGGWADTGPLPDTFLRQGSQTLAGLAGLTAQADLADHSLAAPIAWVPLFLLLFAPVVLGRAPGWAGAALVALLALVGTLGRDVSIAPGEVLWSWPVGGLAELPFAGAFRFPIRLEWLYALLGGVVAARVLDRLARDGSAPVLAGLLVLAAVDAVVGVALPWRNGAQIAAVPSAYDAAPEDRAVLDLWGRPSDGSAGEMEPWIRALSCWYQAHHARPILELCIGTGVRSPREDAERWLLRGLFDGAEPAALRTPLANLGVGAVAMHADSYRATDATLLASRLEATFGAPKATSEDGGERVWMYVLPPGDAEQRDAAWQTIRAGGR